MGKRVAGEQRGRVIGVRCPYCGQSETRVVDSRETDGSAIRRRRECAVCSRRFTTYEKVEDIPIVVSKKNGSVESFQPEKLLRGLLRACSKREVPLSRLEDVVGEVQAELKRENTFEVSSERLGDMVLQRLKSIDLVAYVRFASVYRQFESIEEFERELAGLSEGGAL